MKVHYRWLDAAAGEWPGSTWWDAGDGIAAYLGDAVTWDILSPPFTPAVSLASVESEVAFLSGVNSDGTLATTSFWTYYGPTAHKWGGGVAGTSGGVVTYAFDVASGFTEAELATWRQGLALWMAVADVQFQEVSAALAPAVVLMRGNDGGAYEYDASTPANGRILGTMQTAVISIDSSIDWFSLSGSFSLRGGYGVSTVIHEIGHLLGLGHGGQYNGSVNPLTEQYSAFDMRLWTMMSYIEVFEPAKYDASYPVTGTAWGASYTSHTWAPLDLLAVQRLYGAASGGPLSGGQVYGFNTNIDASISRFYDFTINEAPVVTLYNSGLNNTLDVSGYSENAVIDLRDGHFSSVAGLVNNIAIAFGTRIDHAIGGSGDDSFATNGHSNTIDGGGGFDMIHFAGTMGSYAITITGDYAGTVAAAGVVDTFTGVEALLFDDGIYVVPCFAAGTGIATPFGRVAVECLSIGQHVLTAEGRAAAVKWIGRRAYAAAVVVANPQLRPVRIRAGALGAGVPSAELLVSPCHAMLVDDVLIPAGALVNDGSIGRAEVAGVEYYHVELEKPGLVLAEGAAAETFVDCGSRALFENADEYGALYPNEAVAPAPLPYARLEDGPVVERARRRLAGGAPGRGPGALRGHVERVAGGVLEGWVLDEADGDRAVELEVIATGGDRLRVWANRYRVDLDRAGLAGGRCGFRQVLPRDCGVVSVRRVADGAVVPMMAG